MEESPQPDRSPVAGLTLLVNRWATGDLQLSKLQVPPFLVPRALREGEGNRGGGAGVPDTSILFFWISKPGPRIFLLHLNQKRCFFPPLRVQKTTLREVVGWSRWSSRVSFWHIGLRAVSFLRASSRRSLLMPRAEGLISRQHVYTDGRVTVLLIPSGRPSAVGAVAFLFESACRPEFNITVQSEQIRSCLHPRNQ